ncbi:ABC transporter ATP-binding protein [Rhizobium hainanense]|uniref:NitT/TauT family transport system ATP-binding protein n=1 Tax=Rhizobium hainanense TaxID=52131 RepID=A0A1C3WJW0_9HYPH|nr:ABC transporter ATP-binding protein [Rhizobium hainanense]SCB40249.1 NitT/TauT family transport system ATP-binding protein [Rhizobium hainanense]
MSGSRQRTALRAHQVALRYPGASHLVVANFNLDLASGEIVSILGPSGIGKSSLLRVLAGLHRPVAGFVEVDGAPLEDVHPRLAIAFQNPGLLPWLDLERNVAFGLDFRRQPRLSVNERQARINAAIREVALDHARGLRPSALSGGMAQRAALARCLAREPQVLLLDEPFGALDEVTRAGMQQLLVQVVTDRGSAAVLVTHDIDEALIVSDRILLLGGAPANKIGEWRIDLPRPREDYVAELGHIRIEIVSTLRKAIHHQ